MEFGVAFWIGVALGVALGVAFGVAFGVAPTLLLGSSSYHLAFGRDARHKGAGTDGRSNGRTIYLNIDIDISEWKMERD